MRWVVVALLALFRLCSWFIVRQFPTSQHLLDELLPPNQLLILLLEYRYSETAAATAAEANSVLAILRAYFLILSQWGKARDSDAQEYS